MSTETHYNAILVGIRVQSRDGGRWAGLQEICKHVPAVSMFSLEDRFAKIKSAAVLNEGATETLLRKSAKEEGLLWEYAYTFLGAKFVEDMREALQDGLDGRDVPPFSPLRGWG